MKFPTTVRSLLVSVGVLLLCCIAVGQNKIAQTGSPLAVVQKKAVSLQTVLSCADDPLVKELFDTDRLTADELDAGAMAMMEMERHGRT